LCWSQGVPLELVNVKHGKWAATQMLYDDLVEKINNAKIMANRLYMGIQDGHVVYVQMEVLPPGKRWDDGSSTSTVIHIISDEDIITFFRGLNLKVIK